MSVIITGHSDDLIEIDGDIREEFTYRDQDGDGDLIACSDGTVLRVQLDSQGDWAISVAARGAAAVEVTTAADRETYSDEAVLTGDVRWVVHGTGIAR